MAVRQITMRLPPEMKAEFENYAATLGLDASPLVKLLITRESRRKRLAQLTLGGGAINRERRATRAGTKPAAITAHMPTLEDVTAFDNYAHSCGLARDGAGVWLVETELSERWLERAVNQT
jgi:hypothetical protein